MVASSFLSISVYFSILFLGAVDISFSDGLSMKTVSKDYELTILIKGQ